MIIDCHVHLGTARWMREVQTVPDVRQRMQETGVDSVCCFAFADRGMDANEDVYRATLNEPGFIPFVLCDPTDAQAVQKLEQFLKLGMRGIKLHPFCHGYPLDLYDITDPVFELADRYNVPVVCHCFSDCPFNTPGQFADMAARHPKVNLVALHGGFMWYTWGLVEYCKRRPNLFLETSNLYSKMITDGVRQIGAERFIYGTDFPWSDQLIEIQKIQRAVAATESQELILGINMQRLLQTHSAAPAIHIGTEARSNCADLLAHRT